MIGLRIRLAREVLGITQAELAEVLGTTQPGVASMEAGIYRPSPEYLRTIAHRTGFTVNFFEKGEPPEFPAGSILYRAQAAVKRSPRTIAHGMAHVTFELALSLASRLKRIPINVPKVSEDDSRRAAQITRASLGLSPNTPIKGLIRCLERNGVFVFSLPMQVEGFDGFSAWAGQDPTRPVIAMLRGKSPYREIFTAAEELGHLVMHSPLRVSANQADKEARAFAQEFLLPAEAIENEMQSPITLTSLAALKPRWFASMAFLAKRAESLGLITSNQHRYLIQQIRSNWGARHEPGDERLDAERPSLLRKMATMLYGDPIDLARLTKDCGLPVVMLRDMLGIVQGPARVLEFRKVEGH
jgi:Zn-dependent peptidase ImmA (M78 family)/DNA-binding XRE family transcriptional regulator